MPAPPTDAEQEAQAAAYKQSNKDVDAQVEMSGHSAKEFEITFEHFLASLYMSAMLQLGLMRQQNEQPRIDIIGARQTIDTISLISEKTKGNLTPVEENFLQNSLYELRMAYVEVTNALARPPQPGGPATGPPDGESNDESDLDRAGQRDVHGRAHAGMRLRCVPFTDPHDKRTRPSIMLEYGGKVVLIDTTPDFYEQAVRENIRRRRRLLYPYACRPYSRHRRSAAVQLQAQAGQTAALRAPGRRRISAAHVQLYFRRGL